MGGQRRQLCIICYLVGVEIGGKVVIPGTGVDDRRTKAQCKMYYLCKHSMHEFQAHECLSLLARCISAILFHPTNWRM